MSNTVLEVENLSITFTQYERRFRQRQLQVIRDLNLTVQEGEMVAVVGSSGSGKSLLAHALFGILPYNASAKGDIRFLGQPMTLDMIERVRGHEMVFVPQSVSYLDPLMKVGEQIRKGRNDEASLGKSLEILKRYGMGAETQERYPFELSGGMTRRVMISTAVMEHARLVVADEPTPGLHIDAARRVLSHFREIAEGGAGVLLITHDLELALEVADKIVVFYAGTTVEEAFGEDFSHEERLRHPYTKALYQAMPDHGFSTVAGTQPYVTHIPKGCPYAPRCLLATGQCHGYVDYRELRGGRVRCVHAR